MKQKFKGSITVEMSMLFPIILFSITAIICFSFYMCDIVSIRATAQEYGIISDTENLSEQEIVKEIYNRVSKDKIIVNIESINAKKNSEKTNITINTCFNFALFGISKKNVIKVTVYNSSNRDYIVKSKVAFDIVEKATETNKEN